VSPACDIDLPPGRYIFRVYGALDPHRSEVSWAFCGSHGGATSALEFAVGENLQCSTEKWILTAEEANWLLSHIVLVGSFHLGGMVSQTLSAEDIRLLETVISTEIGLSTVEGGTPLRNRVVITDYSPVTTASASRGLLQLDDSQRLLSSGQRSVGEEGGGASSVPPNVNVDHIRFNAHVYRTSEDTNSLFSDVSLDLSELDAMAVMHHVKAHLATAMDTGTFTAKVVTHAHSLHVKNLQSTRFAKFLSLEVVKEAEINEPISILANAVIALGLLSGVVFGSLLVSFYRTMPKEKKDHVVQGLKTVSPFTRLSSRNGGSDCGDILDVTVTDPLEGLPTGIQLSTIHNSISYKVDRTAPVCRSIAI